MLTVGSARTDITNRVGTVIQGATVGGIAKYIRDALEASAMYLASDNEAVLLISCDLGGLEPDMTNATTAAISARTGIDARRVIIGATHTGGPSVIPTNYVKSVDKDYLKELQVKLVDLADRAMKQAVPAELAIGRGRAAIGYNRRSCRIDGTHAMHPCRDPEEFTGLEGPEDPDHLAIFARDSNGQLIAVLHQCTAHPCTYYGADFYSADYPGYGRKLLREALGEDLPVLFFNGALGDQGQERRVQPTVHESSDAKLVRCGATIAAETLKLLHEADFKADVPLRHLYRTCEVQINLPRQDRLEWADQLLKRVDAGEKIPPMEIVSAHGAALLQRTFGDDTREALPTHVLQIGDTAIVTQPTELFCRLGLDIKRRSPFPITSVFGICDGYRGYCPTYEAIVGGGYSAEPIYWTRFAPDAGYRLVDTACAMLTQLKQEVAARV